MKFKVNFVEKPGSFQMDDCRIGVVLTDVDPEELVRFNKAYDTFMEAEQAMGPTMG